MSENTMLSKSYRDAIKWALGELGELSDLEEMEQKKKSNDYPSEFEWIWAAKPAREGGNPKKQAYQACNARIKDGHTWRDLAEGVKRYRKYCDAKKITGSDKVQQMATFFGTKESFKESWAYAEHQQSTNATSRKLTAEEERNQELLAKYGHTASPTERAINPNEHTGLDQYEVQRGLPEQMEQEGVTIDMDSGYWSPND